MHAGLRAADPTESGGEWQLVSARLRITTWRADDLPTALSLWGDPQVMRYIDARGGLSADQAADRLRQEIVRQDRGGVQYWKVELKTTHQPIGCCGLRPRDAEARIYELGFHIMSSHWRCGYASEAAATVVRYAFDVLHVPMLVAGHHPLNKPSRSILTSLGFRYVGDELYAPTGLHHPRYELLPSGEPARAIYREM